MAAAPEHVRLGRVRGGSERSAAAPAPFSPPDRRGSQDTFRDHQRRRWDRDHRRTADTGAAPGAGPRESAADGRARAGQRARRARRRAPRAGHATVGLMARRKSYRGRVAGPWRTWRLAAMLAAVCACRAPAAAQAPHDIQAIVAHVGERVADYYRRARSLLCAERSTVQPIQSNWSPDGLARTVESELHVELAAAAGDSDPDASVVRKILRINGRAARAGDETKTDSCMDPELLAEAPLDFLLPAHRILSKHGRFNCNRSKQPLSAHF